MKGQSLWLYAHCRLKSDYFPHLLWLRIWSFHFCPNKHSIWFSPCFDIQWKHQMHATNCKRDRKKNQIQGCSLILTQSSSTHWGTKCDSHYHDLEGGFHRSVTVRMPTPSLVHETASFYWHDIQSVPLGYMSLAMQWGPPITALLHLPTSYYPIPFNASPLPPLPSLHKYNQACQERHNHSLTSSIVSDWLCRATIAPSSTHVFEFHWSWLDANRSSPVLPTPTLWPHRVPIHLYITLFHLL